VIPAQNIVPWIRSTRGGRAAGGEKAVKDPRISPLRSGCGPLILVGLALLVGLSTLFVPSIIWQRRELAAVERLVEEARRLGGGASISPGGIDYREREIDLLVDLQGSGSSDEAFAGLERMPAFKHVRRLVLADTQITDRSLELVAKHRRLGLLDLSRTKVTDRGMDAIAKLPFLSTLRLSGTAVTDRGLEALAKRSGSIDLRGIDLTDTRVTAGGVRALSKAFDQLPPSSIKH
jgi:hypothetical protein